MKRIRTDDEIIVIAGKDKGKRGKVLKCFPDDRVLVSGVNVKKKTQKPNPNLDQPGGIIDREFPLHISNVAIFNAATKSADRVGFRFDGDGKKVRYFKSDSQPIV